MAISFWLNWNWCVFKVLSAAPNIAYSNNDRESTLLMWPEWKILCNCTTCLVVNDVLTSNYCCLLNENVVLKTHWAMKHCFFFCERGYLILNVQWCSQREIWSQTTGVGHVQNTRCYLMSLIQTVLHNVRNKRGAGRAPKSMGRETLLSLHLVAQRLDDWLFE